MKMLQFEMKERCGHEFCAKPVIITHYDAEKNVRLYALCLPLLLSFRRSYRFVASHMEGIFISCFELIALFMSAGISELDFHFKRAFLLFVLRFISCLLLAVYNQTIAEKNGR